MKRGLLFFAVLLIGIFLVACAPTPKVTEEPAVEENNAPAISDATVRITPSGFEPKTLTVKAGTTVTFVNEDPDKHWPASAMHPTHTLYPGSDIKKCGTEENIFDACKGLEQGESFSFTFDEKGSWRYHDHLSVSSTGTIVVE